MYIMPNVVIVISMFVLYRATADPPATNAGYLYMHHSIISINFFNQMSAWFPKILSMRMSVCVFVCVCVGVCVCGCVCVCIRP